MDLDELDLLPRPVGVRVVPLARRVTREPLRIEGRVAASRAVLLKAPTSGVVDGLEAQLGTRVSADEVLCTIGAAAQEQRALASKAQLHLLEAQLEERRDGLALARARGEPAERLASFESKLRAAEHRIEQERTNQIRHSKARSLVEVRAPFGGTVAAVSVASGASIVTGNPLLELVEIDPAILVLEVPTWVASRCPEGAPVEVRADSEASSRTGRVRRWAPTASDGVRRLLIEIDNGDGVLAAGEGAVGRLDVGERDAFFAPRAALVYGDKHLSLYLVEHSIARSRRIRVVGGDEDEVEVEVAGQLAASQLVVLHAERKLKEACEVVIRGDH